MGRLTNLLTGRKTSPYGENQPSRGQSPLSSPVSSSASDTLAETLSVASLENSNPNLRDSTNSAKDLKDISGNRHSADKPSLIGSRNNSQASLHHASSLAAKRGKSTVNGQRFELAEDGSHVHHLRNARRQEKLARMLREVMGSGQRVHDDAVSAVPEFVQHSEQLSLMSGLVAKVTKGELEMGKLSGSSLKMKKAHAEKLPEDNADIKTENPKDKSKHANKIADSTCKSLIQKYGKCHEVIGKGSYGVVRVSHKTEEDGKEKLYAVKEFRKRSSETESTFQDRLMSEYCISSQLRHVNIIHTYDLMKDAHGGFCEIMEYCPGGDLYTLILSSGNGLKAAEADCFFKQLVRGVVYMHSMGVAHCDLKPENILLTSNGTIKISDFGNGECFRMAWEKSIHLSKGVCGSGPYIAPEEFKNKPFDPRPVDTWAMGIIYMVMRTGHYLWRTACPDEDDNYEKYLHDRKQDSGYGPIESLSPSKCRYVIYSILDPVPNRRITGKQILNSEWGRSIRVCEAASDIHSSYPPSCKVDGNTGIIRKEETEDVE